MLPTMCALDGCMYRRTHSSRYGCIRFDLFSHILGISLSLRCHKARDISGSGPMIYANGSATKEAWDGLLGSGLSQAPPSEDTTTTLEETLPASGTTRVFPLLPSPVG